ncbi:MAG: 3-deoxy-D-manno-octulosonic acid transferase [Phycisphaerae bacterium]
MKLFFRWLANIGYVLAGLIFLPLAIYRMVRQGRYRRGWKNRCGFVPLRLGERPGIWIHAVSMGEVNAVKPLADRLKQQLPFHEIFISTNTDTGFDRAVKLFGEDYVFFSPFDFSFCVSRAFRRLRPSLIVLMELEVWPNMLSLAREQNIPVVIANGRLTERSARRYKLLGPIVRNIFDQLTLVMAQDDNYRRRFDDLGMGANKVVVTGSLKWDGAPLADSVPSQNDLAGALGIDPLKGLLVAGSTGDDVEEEAVIRAYQQLRSRYNELQLAIIPRKPERFDHVARLINSRGFYPVRRSEFPDGSVPPGRVVAGRPVVFLGDTMGELRKFYGLATAVFVGRTLVPMGGSDVMEVAALGKPAIVGPHVENFTDAVDKLISAGAALQVDRSERLANIIDQILSDKTKLAQMSAAAREVVRSNQGATTRTATYICDILGMEYDQTQRGIASPKLK